MKTSTSTRHQAGDFLIEAVVGLVLVAIISQGVVFISSRAASMQGNMRMQEMAINQMRTFLINNRTGTVDICSSPPVIQLPNDIDITADVQGCDTTTSAIINGVSIAGIPKPISLSVTSDLLGGQLVVGGTWNPL